MGSNNRCSGNSSVTENPEALTKLKYIHYIDEFNPELDVRKHLCVHKTIISLSSWCHSPSHNGFIKPEPPRCSIPLCFYFIFSLPDLGNCSLSLQHFTNVSWFTVEVEVLTVWTWITARPNEDGDRSAEQHVWSKVLVFAEDTMMISKSRSMICWKVFPVLF